MTRTVQAMLVAGTLGAAAAAPGATLAADAEPVWYTEGLNAPESALYDGARDVLYVSNVNGGPMDKNGEGHIARLTADGTVTELAWVTGLNAPKGLALDGGTLYVADIDQLVAIDVDEGAIIERHDGADAQFLNDVTVDGEGRVYVSDMMTNAIYRLADGAFEVWLQDDALEQPNGLHAESDRLVVGAWGVMTDGFATKTPGHLKAVDLATKAVASIGAGEPIGNLDGVEPDGEGNYLATDWMAGTLYRIDEAGGAEQLLDLDQGSADLEYRQEENLAIIPMMNDGGLAAYRIE